MDRLYRFLVLGVLALSLVACGSSNPTTVSTDIGNGPVTLILGAYTTPREAYAEIIPLL